MPSIITPTFKILPLQPSEQELLQPWAVKKYKEIEETSYQMIQQIVKLEFNIANLENMLQKEECPRSLKVNVKINVCKNQQANMDAIVQELAKNFEQNALKALIEERKKELINRKQEVDQKCLEYETFLKETFLQLKRNRIPIRLEDSAINPTIHNNIRILKARTKDLLDLYKRRYFFRKQEAEKKLQQRKAKELEKQINQELEDPKIAEMKRKLEALTRTVKSLTIPKKFNNVATKPFFPARKNIKTRTKTNKPPQRNFQKPNFQKPVKKVPNGPKIKQIKSRKYGQKKILEIRTKPRTRKRKPTTIAPLHKHNDPIGFSAEKISKEAKLVLRIGHKFAFCANIHKSISEIIQELDKKIGKKITKLSKTETKNWHQWKLSALKYILSKKHKPKPIESMLQKGITDLKNMEIVVKQADKNLGLVPIRGDYYAAMLRSWLIRPSFERVQEFPHENILQRIKNTIKSTWAISIDEKERWINHAKNATHPCPFYAIPKIHKADPLGSRPISAQHSYMMAPLSKTLTTVLLRFQNTLQGITKDTQSFVRRIEKFQAPSVCVLLTYDVEKCYPNIDLNDAIKTLHDNIPEMQTNFGFWTKILKLIMFNNYVTANNGIYRQMIGTATGTQVAPPFANLYLYYKYKNALADKAIFLHERFIDDGFVVVKTENDAKRIVQNINNACSLNITFEIDNRKAIFLDLEIYKGERYKNQSRFDLKTYFKPTNRLLYLPWNSNHPPSMKKGIIVGEAIRTLRNSSDKISWLNALKYIFKGLLARGYPHYVIKKEWKKIQWNERDYYVHTNTTKELPNGLLILTRFNPNTKKEWKEIMTKYPFENIFPKTNLRWNQRQIGLISKWPPKIVWHSFKKIGHHLISAKQCWHYPSIRRKIDHDLEKRTPKKRIRLS